MCDCVSMEKDGGYAEGWGIYGKVEGCVEGLGISRRMEDMQRYLLGGKE